jgi:hypothetical protein
VTKAVVTVSLSLLLLWIGVAWSSSIRGHYREAHLKEEKFARLRAGGTYEFVDVFRGNQRACVIIEGDHNPIINLTVKVFDSAGKEVAVDNGGGDVIAAMWYPPRTQEYRVVVGGDGAEFNDLDIVVK